MEFIGHGALGLHHPAAWASYFAVVGIGEPTAFALMPVVGLCDILLGILVLVYPIRPVVLYMALWGLWTALLRPLAGESGWEAVERAGNCGALWGLYLLLVKSGTLFKWAVRSSLDGHRRRQLAWALRLTTALLLMGHGALDLLLRKPFYGTEYAVLGLHNASLEPLMGAFEGILGVAVLLWPGVGLLLFAAGWKLLTETLSPRAGTPVWVFIEHGSSYAAPLALALLNRRKSDRLRTAAPSVT